MQYILTDQALTAFVDGKPIAVVRQDPRWDQALEALRANDADKLHALLHPAKLVRDFVSGTGHLRLENGVLVYKGTALPGESYFVQRCIQLRSEDFPIDPIVNFIERLLENPSFRARAELLQFLEYGNLPMTEDGHFLAYKRVREDYKDCHSGTIDNSVGQVVEMPRADVDDNSDHTCSSGLHFCSREYLQSFWGERLMVLKIDPKDVVSIPTDYNNTKGRCCKYVVHAELPVEEHKTHEFGAPVITTAVVPTRNFDLDDRVQVVSDDEYNGLVGTIIEIDDSPTMLPYQVDFMDGFPHWFAESELTPEPATEAEERQPAGPHLVAGTRVRYIGTKQDMNHIAPGDIAYIIENDGTPVPYKLVREDDYDPTINSDKYEEYDWVYANEVEVV